ncbi:hypothetical protein LBMAG42_25580 [Deltaproteobacteria bacterium]|nr:hypothetical protein LBMAG42_25580 [Deltaproteobacteria bacterium]
MPILGVIVNHPSPPDLCEVLRWFALVSRVGDPVGPAVPLVLDLAHSDDVEAALDALRALPNVVSVGLAFADFSDEARA